MHTFYIFGLHNCYVCISLTTANTLDLAEAFPFFAGAAVVVAECSAASVADCLLEAGLEDEALLLGGGAVGLCFSNNPTTTCLEAGYDKCTYVYLGLKRIF